MNAEEKYALIDKHFPDALMNDGDEFMGEPRVRYDLLGIAGLCGCGIPEGVAGWYAEYLSALARKTTDLSGDGWVLAQAEATKALLSGGVLLDSPAHYAALYWMDDQGWIEHGSNVSCPWITDKGRAAIVAMDLLVESEEDE